MPGEGVQVTLILCAYVGVISWFLSRIYYERQWGKDVLRRVESLCAPQYGIGRGKAPIHWDQDCTLSLRPLNVSLSVRRTVRRATSPSRWRVAPVRFIKASRG